MSDRLRAVPGGRARAERTPRDAELIGNLERGVVGALIVAPALSVAF